MVWHAGLIGKDATTGKPTGWADMHQRLFHANGDDSVYFVGDLMGAISPQFGHYPKSAHVANFIGQIVAKYIAQRVAGQEIKPLLPDNLCYMMVNTNPQEGISVQFDYKVNDQGIIEQTQLDFNERSPATIPEDFNWARLIYEDMFS